MATKVTIEKRIAFRQQTLDKLYEAYEQLISGKVKSYLISDRQLTYVDLGWIGDEIRRIEDEIDALEAQLTGLKPRRSVGVLPRDW